jgi:tRNA threonylcarbamoyladenosine biosynthesis protein TsaB
VLILSLDTTTRGGSVAVVRDGQVVYLGRGDATRTHGERLPADLMTACDQAGVTIGEVELFAVAAGPGSFTGLRIGIATMQGLAMARGRRIVAVSALEAVAASSAPDARERRHSRTVAWIDAQRGEVFSQVFEGMDPISPAIAASPLSAIEMQRGLIAEAEFHGDGAVRYRDQILAALGPGARIGGEVVPLAGAIGQIAARQPDRAVRPHAVVPIYVRRPDAEIARTRQARPSA